MQSNVWDGVCLGIRRALYSLALRDDWRTIAGLLEYAEPESRQFFYEALNLELAARGGRWDAVQRWLCSVDEGRASLHREWMESDGLVEPVGDAETVEVD